MMMVLNEHGEKKKYDGMMQKIIYLVQVCNGDLKSGNI